MELMLSSFSQLEDPRLERRREYPLESIVFIAICAVVSGSNTWTEIEYFGKTKQQWLSKYIYLPEGKAPCDDVYASVFSRIDHKEFGKCFIDWTEHLCGLVSEDLIAIEGKTLRGSSNKATNKKAIHMVSAWSANNQIVLGQYKTDEKSNEITAIPALLNLLEIKGSIISIDAMGTQREIASLIIDKEADYILGLKSNQERLLADVSYSFRDQEPEDTATNITKGHGRIETRTCEVITDLKHLETLNDWRGLKSIIRITSKRLEVLSQKESTEQRYYICSAIKKASVLNDYIRGHWGIENKLHWTLDVNFKEDLNQTRTGFSDANFNTIKHISLNILKLDKSLKQSLKLKRYKAVLDDDFREQLLKI